MKQVKLIALSVILAIAVYAAKYAYVWASTPVTGTTSFDYLMSGVFAVFGVFMLAIFAIMLVYSILESKQITTTTTEDNAPKIKPTIEEYNARQAARVAEYNTRQAAAVAEYNTRQAALVAAYNARQAAAIAAYIARNN
jgi:uncharacterized membrane protein